MPRPKKITISLFLIALVALYVVIEIIPMLSGALTGTETLTYGDLRVSESVECYLVRSETVYGAPSDGIADYKASEGDLVKRGSTVMAFDASAGDGDQESEYRDYMERLGNSLLTGNPETAQMRGVFSTYIDGYERLFAPDALEDLTYEAVRRLSIKGTDVARKRALEGEPLYKISDNRSWYLVFWTDPDAAQRYESGAKVTAILPQGQIAATVYGLSEEGDRVKVILRSNRYYAGFAKERILEGEIVTIDQRGLLVGNHCLTTKDGVVGVYVKDTIGEYHFKPVRTIATDGKQTLVLEGVYYDENGQPVETVNVYDEVLKKPEAN